MPTPKLDRTQPHAINANPGDNAYLWECPYDEDRKNFTMQNASGDDVLTIYGLTCDQLAALYLDIAGFLGKSPEPTVHHLKQMHEKIGELIKEAEPVRQSEPDAEWWPEKSETSTGQ